MLNNHTSMLSLSLSHPQTPPPPPLPISLSHSLSLSLSLSLSQGMWCVKYTEVEGLLSILYTTVYKIAHASPNQGPQPSSIRSHPCRQLAITLITRSIWKTLNISVSSSSGTFFVGMLSVGFDGCRPKY